MRCFVTGADGFIGSHLVEALLALGHSVKGLALYNPAGSYGWMDGIHGMTKVHGDVRDADQMRFMIAGMDVVFHLAAHIEVPYSFLAPRTFVDTNLLGTMNILEAARETNAKVIVTSSSEVYGTAVFTPQTELHPLQAQSPYAASKIAADALAESYRRTYDMDVTILRPFNTYGPRQSERAVIPRIIRQDMENDSIILGDLTPKRDLTYVTDTVAAFIAAIELGGGPYNAGSGHTISIGDLAKKITDKPLVSMTRRPENSEVHLLMADSSKLRKESGWEPKVSLDEGLKLTKEWFYAS